MKPTEHFAAAATLAVTSALSTGVSADNVGVSTQLADLQNMLNLQEQNTFYIPTLTGTGIRIDEVCEVTGDDTVTCHMLINNGSDGRVLERQDVYQLDDNGQLASIESVQQQGQFYSANGSYAGNMRDNSVTDGIVGLDSKQDVLFEDPNPRGGNNSDTIASNGLDDDMQDTWIADKNAKFEVAQEAGYDTPYNMVLEVAVEGEAYRTASADMTTIEETLHNNEAQGFGKFIGVDRFSPVYAGEDGAVSYVNCKLIPPAGMDGTAFDVDLEASNRALCATTTIGDDFNNKVTTTYSVHATTDGQDLRSAIVVDQRDIGLGANGEIDSDADVGLKEELQDRLGDRVHTNIVGHTPG